jgi:tight adherence protein B
MLEDQLLTLNFAGLFLFGVALAIAIYYLYFIIEDAAKKGSTNYIGWMVVTLDKMFIKITHGNFLLILIASIILSGLAGFYVSIRYGVLNYIITISFIFIGWNIPRFYINYLYGKRLEKFNHQLIDSLTLMSNSLKSGLNLNQVISVVVQEMPNPISQEFGLVLSQHQLGLTIDEALEKMMERIPSEDLQLVINSILILREKGGDISETFETIANTIRERRKVESKIKTITAQGRMQSMLLFLMPFGIGVVMYFLNPENMELLFTTELGWLIVSVMLVMQAIGGLWLKKIVDIEV